MASACLPTLFRAVEIDGEAYWDGGYAGNPTIAPLVRDGGSADDLLLVAINPVDRPGTPRSATEIQNRLNEISFNATIIKELRMIALLQQVVAESPAKLDSRRVEGARWGGTAIEEGAGEAVAGGNGRNRVSRAAQARAADHAIVRTVAKVDHFAAQQPPAFAAAV